MRKLLFNDSTGKGGLLCDIFIGGGGQSIAEQAVIINTLVTILALK